MYGLLYECKFLTIEETNKKIKKKRMCISTFICTPHRMDQQYNNRKRKDLRQILKEPKLKHKNNPVVGRETDSTQCETFGS